MNSNDQLDPELEALEVALRRRPKPVANAALGARVIASLERAAARERRTRAFALAACAASFLGLHVWLSSLWPAAPAARPAEEPTKRELTLFASVGLDAELVRHAARVRSLAHVPREARPMGSGTLISMDGGR